jgi:hypothetical protein
MNRIELDTVSIAAGAPPTEFRLLKAGVNQTEKGPLLFDQQAAAAVMQRFNQQGVDLMIDLNHDSLDEQARRTRRDAADAVGWCRLQVRPGPELWAVDVRWNSDGAARLAKKTQRYISPVAFYEPETRRVAEVFNLALVAMPATHGAPALVAASRLRAPVPVNVATQQAATVALGRANSAVLSARVPLAVKRELELRAGRLYTTPGRLLRALVAAAVSSNADRARLCDLLGLPATAADDAVTAAVAQLLIDTAEPPPAADAGATAGNAETPPAPLPPAIAAASRDVQARFVKLQTDHAHSRAVQTKGNRR